VVLLSFSLCIKITVGTIHFPHASLVIGIVFNNFLGNPDLIKFAPEHGYNSHIMLTVKFNIIVVVLILFPVWVELFVSQSKIIS